MLASSTYTQYNKLKHCWPCRCRVRACVGSWGLGDRGLGGWGAVVVLVILVILRDLTWGVMRLDWLCEYMEIDVVIGDWRLAVGGGR